MEWLYLLLGLFGAIFAPSFFSALRDRYQAPGLNKNVDKEHQKKITDDTVNNETERARIYRIFYG